MSATTETPADESAVLSDESPDNLTKDKIFHILQTQRRRDALRYLKENDGPVEMRDLAEQVAAWENNTTLQALTSDERQRVYIALYQSHLPKLDKEDIIKYNQSRGVVERGPLAEQFDPYLNTLETDDTDLELDATIQDDDRWFHYYRWATVASVGTLVGSWINLPFLSALPGHFLGAFVVMLYAAISTIHFFR
ncbi:DUF7344 domain-containing protein [Haladaptatus salinisoli]|uniref:DUF7344 domain-containing protein n=1 Tax=Haladaptatus salinisoli TaxID=2884876 RepID=UPI001D0B00FB|nr:hypothetical protein [Haladaptatus salinisoli]